MDSNSVGVRTSKEGDKGAMGIDEFIAQINDEIKLRK
jgi:threonyl-tRNA synthetase